MLLENYLEPASTRACHIAQQVLGLATTQQKYTPQPNSNCFNFAEREDPFEIKSFKLQFETKNREKS